MKVLTIRVEDEIRFQLKQQADKEGMLFSKYLKKILVNEIKRQEEEK